MALLPFIALAALAVAAVSLWRLSRLPRALPEVVERTFRTLRPGDVVLVADGDWLVSAREPLPGAAEAHLVALRSGRERRWLLATESGPVALLPSKPDTADVDRAVAALGGKKLDRATVDLLPGETLPPSEGRA
jgi:hypothetical protein